MSEKTLKKTKSEIGLLYPISLLSLLVSTFLFGGLRYTNPPDQLFMLENDWYIYSIRAIFGSIEFAIGIVWFIYSLKILLEIIKIMKNHAIVFDTKKYDKEINTEEKRKDTTFALIRDTIAFYRGYHKEILILTIFSLLIGIPLIISNIFMLFLNNITLFDLIFGIIIRLLFPGLLLIIITIIYINLTIKWGKKLVKIGAEEQKLQEFLGDTVET